MQQALRTRPLQVRTPEQVSQHLRVVRTPDQYDQLLELQADAATYTNIRCLAMRQALRGRVQQWLSEQVLDRRNLFFE